MRFVQGVGAQLPDEPGRVGAPGEQMDGAGGEVGGGERGRVAVGERGLQLSGAGTLFVVEAGGKADRGDPHVGAAALGADLAGVLPAPALVVQQGARGQAGVARRPVVLRRVVPVRELLAQRPLQPVRREVPALHGRAERAPEGEGHLGVVGDEGPLGQLHLPPGPERREDRRHGLELGREAEGVPEGEAEECSGGRLLGHMRHPPLLSQ
ncbi:hypothetical protein GCM10017687_16740 [Streptomyces echinatus]